MCSCKPSLTSALDGLGGQRHIPTTLTPAKKKPVHVVQGVGWIRVLAWTNAGNLAPLGFHPQTVQPVASRCTD